MIQAKWRKLIMRRWHFPVTGKNDTRVFLFLLSVKGRSQWGKSTETSGQW